VFGGTVLSASQYTGNSPQATLETVIAIRPRGVCVTGVAVGIAVIIQVPRKQCFSGWLRHGYRSIGECRLGSAGLSRGYEERGFTVDDMTENTIVENTGRAAADAKPCATLDEVRMNIDRIDRQLVTLIAERGGFVAQAATFKTSTEDVKAPKRVEAVISKLRAYALQEQADPDTVEAIWRTMIANFTKAEIKDFAETR
jgi:isochorismate pyruvate lyase